MFFKTEDQFDSKLLTQLIALGSKQQYLTYEQIEVFFPNISCNKTLEEKFKMLKDLLGSMNISDLDNLRNKPSTI